MSKKASLQNAHNPLILRCHRLMEAFAKSDDERDFFLDKQEGFILFIDLDKSGEELLSFEKEIEKNSDRYCPIPKLTFYETKKIMEGFVNEKVYDIDTKEKLLDIISSKEARENFLDFIYDHDTEFEKWQQYYQERSRIRIIEWLRQYELHFVFEEDLDLTTNLIDKLKHKLFEKTVAKDIQSARKILEMKAKTYYSSEALNPRPKRGRPPKQTAKVEVEQQISTDIYTTVPKAIKPFLFTPDIGSALEVTFYSKFESGDDLLANQKKGGQQSGDLTLNLETLNAKLESLKTLSTHWKEEQTADKKHQNSETVEREELLQEITLAKPLPPKKALPKVKAKAEPKPKATPKSVPAKAKTAKKRPLVKLRKVSKVPKPKAKTAKKIATPKMKAAAPKKTLLRRKTDTKKSTQKKTAEKSSAKAPKKTKPKQILLRRKK